MNMGKYDNIRNNVTQMLKEEVTGFEYKGHGAHIGLWETPDFIHLEKPFGQSYTLAQFRMFVFIPVGYGTEIKIEIFLPSVGEWETVFEGYISDISDISKILNFQLGIPKTVR